MGAWLYIIQCADGAYYTGITRGELGIRIAEHQAGRFDGFTSIRRPVVLKYSEYFERIVDGIAAERQIKRWSRAKKEALIAGGFGSPLRSGAPANQVGASWFETPRYARLLIMRVSPCVIYSSTPASASRRTPSCPPSDPAWRTASGTRAARTGCLRPAAPRTSG
jgi:putative endonuclease